MICPYCGSQHYSECPNAGEHEREWLRDERARWLVARDVENRCPVPLEAPRCTFKVDKKSPLWDARCDLCAFVLNRSIVRLRRVVPTIAVHEACHRIEALQEIADHEDFQARSIQRVRFGGAQDGDPPSSRRAGDLDQRGDEPRSTGLFADHPLDDERLAEDAFPELTHLVSGLVALHESRPTHEIRHHLSAWEMFAGLR